MKKNLSIFLVVLLILSMLPSNYAFGKIKDTDNLSEKTITLSYEDIKTEKLADFQQSEDDTYLIKYRNSEEKEKGTSKIKKKGGNIRKEFKKNNVVKAKLTKELLKDIKSDSSIECIEPDFKVKVSNEEIPWGVEEIGAPIAHQDGIKGDGVKIAVFDTGVNKHSDIKLSGGISFVNGVDSYADDNGHGTHVAGTISSLLDGQGVVGVAPEAELYSVKIIKSDGTGSYSSIIDAIEWSIDNNINIINMSFGGGVYSQILEEAIDTAYENNILIFASAGNDGAASTDTITYPAKYANVISVGAVDKDANRASFSSIGPDLELVAPGVGIKSTLSNGNYGMMSGTSMACPHAVGVAALLWSKNLSISNSIIRELLDYSAVGLGDKTEYGNGLVSISNSLEIYDKYISMKKGNSGLNNKVPKKVKIKNNKNEDGISDISIKTIIQHSFESAHPYTNNYTNSWTTSRTDASNIRVHFEYISTEPNYDFVTTSAGDRWSGAYTNLWSSWSNTSSITTTLSTDGSVTGNGFRVDMIEYVPIANPTPSDDYGNSMSSAKNISAGSSLSGNINYAGDEDFFKFTASITGTFTIGTSGSTDTYGYLLDSSGNQLAYNDDSNGTANFSISYSLNAGQTYYIRVRHYSSNGTGPYNLLVSAPTPSDDHSNSISGATNIYLDSIVAGNINYAGDEDYFRFTPTTTGNYIMGTLGSTDTYGYLLDSSGNQLAYNDDNNGTANFGINYSLNAGQTYYIRVRHYSSSGTGSYNIVIKIPDDHGNSISASTNISVDSQVNGNIEYAGDEDYFRFIAPINGTFTIGTIGSIDTYGYLLDSSGNQLAYNDDGNGTANFSISYSLNAGQTYYIKVRHYSSTETGSYALLVTSPPADDSVSDYYGGDFSTAKVVQVGNTVSCAINVANDTDFFKVIPSLSGLYSIETLGNTDTVGTLYDSSQAEISTSDDLVDLNFRIIYYLDAGQTYYVRARHYSSSSTGMYSFKVIQQYDDNIQQRTIQVNTPLSGSIDCPEDIDVFAFTPSATNQYVIESTSIIDLTGVLYNDTSEIALNDDNGIDHNFRIVQTLNANQTYYIGVKAYNKSDEGSYTISISHNTAGYQITNLDNNYTVENNPLINILSESDDGLSRRAITGYIQQNTDWLKSDSAGRTLLLWWLFSAPGGQSLYPRQTITNDNGILQSYPVYDIYNNTMLGGKYTSNNVWGPYMMKSIMLTYGNPRENSKGVKELLTTEFNKMANGSTRSININTHMAIENGESIIGHQYLHGTSSKVGEFQITGSASKDSSGNVTAQLHFKWNDVIDPNFDYSTDALKSEVAQKLPAANPTDYIIKIGWDFKVIKNVVNPPKWQFWKPGTTWPY